jgi:hypothetical protein
MTTKSPNVLYYGDNLDVEAKEEAAWVVSKQFAHEYVQQIGINASERLPTNSAWPKRTIRRCARRKGTSEIKITHLARAV